MIRKTQADVPKERPEGLRNYHVPSDVLSRSVRNICVLAKRNAARYYLLEDVGAEVWRLVSQNHETEGIVGAIANRYDVSRHQVRLDVVDLLTELVNEQLLLPDEDEKGRCPGRTSPGGNERVASMELSSADILSRVADECIPLQGFIEITRRCNERCVHCFLQDQRDRQSALNEMTTTTVIRLLEEMADAGCMECGITGGEPGIRRDLEDVIANAYALGMKVNLWTNGTLLPRARLKAIAGMIEEIRVSLYGSTAAAHDGVTQLPGSWRATTDFLAMCSEEGIQTVAQMPLMKQTVRQVEDTYALARKCGVQFRIGLTIEPTLLGNMAPTQLGISDQDITVVYRAAHTGRLGECVELDLNDRPATLPPAPCAAGFRMFSIRPDGTVDPCGKMPLPVGNVREDSFVRIWHESEELKKLRERLSVEIGKWKCPQCPLWQSCWLNCPGAALVETGDLWEAPASRCRYMRIVVDEHNRCALGNRKEKGDYDEAEVCKTYLEKAEKKKQESLH